MKRVIGLWLGFAGFLSAGTLTFQETEKVVNATPADSAISVDYAFTNNTGKPVTLDRATGNCSCTSVDISGGKTSYAPGESGVLRANFDIGNFQGGVDKIITVWLDGAPESKPSQQLKLRVNIPVLIEMEPKSVKWDIGESPEAKKVEIRINGEKPIHVLSVSASRPDFTHELKTIEDGKRYELIVKPVKTEAPGIAIFKVVTDSAIERQKTQQAFAVVKRPDSKFPGR